MPPVTRSVLSVVIGCLAAFFHIGAIESLNFILYPLPEGLDPSKPETLVEYIKTIPNGALLIVLLAWAVGTFAGSWVTTKLAPVPKRYHGLIIGVLLMMAAIGNMTTIPHPTWFWIISLATFLPVSYLGSRLAAPRNTPVSESSEMGGRQS